MIYNFFCWTIWVISLPFVIFLKFYKEKFKYSLPARFFLYKNPKIRFVNIHFHACSYGEICAIEKIAKNFDNFAITCTTQTGYEKAKTFCENVSFLPFENLVPFWIFESEILVIFEAELWLNLVRYAKKQNTRVVLLNARISDNSFKSYKIFKFYYQKVFENIDLVLAQSEIDKERLEILGAKNIKIIGNVKSAFLPKITRKFKKPSGRTIVIASSHKGEEEMILKNLSLKNHDTLFIVPRHPERFVFVDKIAKIYAQKNGCSYKKFSEYELINSQVVLMDKMGELINLYAIADVVVLCGSFLPQIGGHNPIEAAQFNCSIISGRFYANQKNLYSLIEGIQMCNANEITTLLNSNLPKTNIINHTSLEEIIKLIKG